MRRHECKSNSCQRLMIMYNARFGLAVCDTSVELIFNHPFWHIYATIKLYNQVGQSSPSISTSKTGLPWTVSWSGVATGIWIYVYGKSALVKSGYVAVWGAVVAKQSFSYGCSAAFVLLTLHILWKASWINRGNKAEGALMVALDE